MPPEFHEGPNGRLAFEAIDGEGPTIVWLGGYKSDMSGTKAQHLADWARRLGRAFVRFDYSGHGASDGRFVDLALSDWLADSLSVIDELTDGPLILVGSSMGGWIAALAAVARRERIAGVVFIAPAPDFTESLMWRNMNEAQRAALMAQGYIEEPTDYAPEPNIITRRLIEDGRNHLILDGAVAIDAPVRILQGMADPDVPYDHALRFAALLESDDVVLTLTKSGDHRLSTPEDLERLAAAIEGIGRRGGMPQKISSAS